MDKRSRSQKEKKDKRRRRSHKPPEEEEDDRKKEKRSRREETVEVKVELSKTPERVNLRAEEESEVSEVREDRRSPPHRHDDDEEAEPREKPRVPKSPSRSPPGFNRNQTEAWDDRDPIERHKPKKDKGYNHYLRGKDYRDRYGHNRGRGRGQGPFDYPR